MSNAEHNCLYMIISNKPSDPNFSNTWNEDLETKTTNEEATIIGCFACKQYLTYTTNPDGSSVITSRGTWPLVENSNDQL